MVVYARTCDACGNVVRVVRHATARRPRKGLYCPFCGTEQPQMVCQGDPLLESMLAKTFSITVTWAKRFLS